MSTFLRRAILLNRPISRNSSCRIQTRCQSTLLARLRPDLMTAMRAKDNARLSVLRALLASITNASKTAKPVDNDITLLALIRKSVTSQQGARDEFKSAGRQDLADKEEAQIKVLEEYAGQVEVVGEQEIKDKLQRILEVLKAEGTKADMGSVMKRAKDAFTGKSVESSELARLVKDAVS